MQNIHFKVAANGSIRRFALPEANYSKLQERVKILFGFDSSTVFAIQWKDKEGNLRPLSSDEDLTNVAKQSDSLIHLSLENSKPQREKKERKPRRSESNPEKYMARLLKKQCKCIERLSAVSLEDTKKRLRLQKKLADINAKIGECQAKPDAKEEAEENPSTPANQITTPLPVCPAPGKLELAVTPPSKTALKEASRQYYLLRKNIKEEKMKIKNLSKVLAAVKLLYRTDLGDTACRVVVDIEHVNKTKLDLALARTQMVEKRQLAKDQALVVRNLACLRHQMEPHAKKHQRHEKPGREHRKDKKEKRHRKEKKEKKEKRHRKEKKEKRQPKQKME